MGNYEKLKGICLQIDNLIALKVVRSSNEFQIWLKNTRRFLCNCFGENSIELREFNKLHFDLALVNVENWERVEKCKNDLEIAKGMFENYRVWNYGCLPDDLMPYCLCGLEISDH